LAGHPPIRVGPPAAQDQTGGGDGSLSLSDCLGDKGQAP
jgi:hypothetical protein